MRLFSFVFFILSFCGASTQGNSDSLISIRLERAGLADVFTVVEQAHVRALIDYNNERSARKRVPWISGI